MNIAWDAHRGRNLTVTKNGIPEIQTQKESGIRS